MNMQKLIALVMLPWAAFPSIAGADVDLAFATRAVSAPTASETTTTLPASEPWITVGHTYYLEVWVSDVGSVNTGVTAAYVDLVSAGGTAGLVAVDHGTLFAVLPTGIVLAGGIDELGGMTFAPGVGVEPVWARVATVEIAAAQAGSATYTLADSASGCAAYGRGAIAWDAIDLGPPTVVVHDPDCNGNGIPDPEDIAQGTSPDCNGNGIPDECEPDCNGNGVADECDISNGTSADCQPDGVPDECQLVGNDCNTNGEPDDCDILWGNSVDCNENGSPDSCELEAGQATDCNANGTLDECDIAAGDSEDCNENGLPDECDLSGGTSSDCEPNGIPDECEPDCDGDGITDACALRDCLPGALACADCNGNAVPDGCDITTGTSGDCNNNAIPDECDIAAGTSTDCANNGIPDECEPDCNGNAVADGCDIDFGQSEDCNANGVPDECDIASGASRDCQPNGIPDDCEWAARGGVVRGWKRSVDVWQWPDQQAHGGWLVVPVDWEQGAVAAESFTFADDMRLQSLTWWGTYQDVCGEPAEGTDDFVVAFYMNEGATANQRVAVYELGADVSRYATGATLPVGEGLAEYQYTGALDPPLEIVGGRRYWVEIRNRVALPNRWWWETAPPAAPANGAALYDANADGYDDGDLLPCDLAFGMAGLASAEDCNGNGVEDADDIAGGFSLDCQGDGIPDECQADRNFNDQPDFCDIRDGLSWDSNYNGVPDEADCLTIRGDLDRDCDVDLDDYVMFANCLGRSGEEILWVCPCADFDGSGTIDGADFQAFTVPFGSPAEGCLVPPIDPCPETWATNPAEVSFYDFGSRSAIPAGFFGDGSDPFAESVQLIGMPTADGLRYNGTDTSIQHGPVVFEPGATVAVTDIYIHKLRLVCPTGITVTYDNGQRSEDWQLIVLLSPNNPVPGQLIATLYEPGANAGTFDAWLSVQPLFVFTKMADLRAQLLPECVTRRFLDTGASAPGVPPLPPIDMSFFDQPFVRVAAPHIVAEMEVSPCAQGNFVAGVEETRRGDNRSQQQRCMQHVTPDEDHDFCASRCYDPGLKCWMVKNGQPACPPLGCDPPVFEYLIPHWTCDGDGDDDEDDCCQTDADCAGLSLEKPLECTNNSNLRCTQAYIRAGEVQNSGINTCELSMARCEGGCYLSNGECVNTTAGICTHFGGTFVAGYTCPEDPEP